MTWDTTHVNSGDYSLQLVAQDIYTGLRAVAETVLKVSPKPAINNSAPQFIMASTALPNDIIYTTPGSLVTQELTVEDSNGVEGLSVNLLSPPPEGMSISMVEQSSMRGTAPLSALVGVYYILLQPCLAVMVTVSWSVPSSVVNQPVIVCLEASDGQVTSTPLCLTFRVLMQTPEVKHHNSMFT